MILGFERSGQTGNNGSSRPKPPNFVLWRGQTRGYNDVTGDQPPLDGWPPLYLYQPTYHPSRRGVIYCPTPSLQPESALSRTRTPNRNLHRGVVGLWGPPPLAPILRSSALGAFDASTLRSRSPSALLRGRLLASSLHMFCSGLARRHRAFAHSSRRSPLQATRADPRLLGLRSTYSYMEFSRSDHQCCSPPRAFSPTLAPRGTSFFL